MNYKEVEFKKPRSLDDFESERSRWLQWRYQGIGSSDAAVIMGVSRFNDWDNLLIQKSGTCPPEDNSNTYIKERGNKIEFQVRMFLEQRDCVSLAAKNCEHLVFPFLRASLDCMTETGKTIAEIKLLSSFNPSKPNTEAEGYKKWLAAKNNRIVPDEYWPQIQHQLFITGADTCLFVGYKEVKGNTIVTEDKLAIVEVKPDKEYQQRLFLKCCEFWYKVEEIKQIELNRIRKELE